MKYEQQILEAYKTLSMSPRENQVQYINDVIVAFIDDKKPYVVLNAPTGTGKSIIGAVIASVLNMNNPPEEDNKLASLILMHNNALTKQYYQTFSKFGKDQYLQIKGANNYKCEALSTDDGDGRINAENCAVQKFRKEGLDELTNKYCNRCEYQILKRMKNDSANVITNFSYYFVDRQFADTFKPRDVVIWDEAHTINDAFCEHNAIYFSKDRLKKLYEELSESLKLTDLGLFKKLKIVQLDLEAGKINDSNYKHYLKILNEVYHTAFAELSAICEASGNDITKYTKFSKMSKKYFGLGCKVDDLLNYNYEHIFEFNEKTFEATVKPIFIGSMFEDTLIHSKYNLFMSATISKDYITETLKIDPSKVAFIKVPPTFPKEHKQIVFFNTQNLNFRSMQDEKTVQTLCKNVERIVKKHITDYSENGIILTPSFVLTEKLANAIRAAKIPVKVFEHTKGMKADDVLESFKKSKVPSVVISPSIYEGIDLPGDLSRFQIIVKAPFPSLAEKRMKYILDNHPNIYNLLTIQKIVQGGGRSVRSMDDYAVTYILDSNAQRLFNNPLNVWKDEFEVSFSSVL
jgi:ATP-dependent DNA helicase DinG